MELEQNRFSLIGNSDSESEEELDFVYDVPHEFRDDFGNSDCETTIGQKSNNSKLPDYGRICPICQKKFKNQKRKYATASNVRFHIKTVHHRDPITLEKIKEELKTAKCPKCSKMFTGHNRARNLRNHLKNNGCNKNYPKYNGSCPICHKKFVHDKHYNCVTEAVIRRHIKRIHRCDPITLNKINSTNSKKRKRSVSPESRLNKVIDRSLIKNL